MGNESHHDSYRTRADMSDRRVGKNAPNTCLRRSNVFAVLATVALFCGACGASGDDEIASIEATPAGEPASTTAVIESQGEDTDEQAGQSENSNATASTPTEGTASLVEGANVQFVQLPYVAPIVFPEVAQLSSVGSDIKSELGEYSADGVSVDSATCDAAGATLRKNEESGFLSIDVDASGIGYFYDNSYPSGRVEITVTDDGSGQYYNDTFDSGRVEVTVAPDGSGVYYNDTFDSGRIEVTVAADRFGTYYNDTFASGRIEVTLDGQGSGYYRNDTFANGRVEVTVEPNNLGTFYKDNIESGRIEFARTEPNAFFLYDDSHPTGRVELTVLADGSGNYYNDTGSDAVSITVASDGTGSFDDGTTEATFTTAIGILDPGLIQTSPGPDFVADRSVPKLDRLAPLQAPCASVIRIDDSVLFDFDSDQLRPTAGPVLDEIASALSQASTSLAVHGHTDSKGDDSYNLDLSERRAAAVAEALRQRGVTAEIESVGFGESAPVAPNETESGEDNPAGRQKNRRVEIVVED